MIVKMKMKMFVVKEKGRRLIIFLIVLRLANTHTITHFLVQIKIIIATKTRCCLRTVLHCLMQLHLPSHYFLSFCIIINDCTIECM